MLCKLYSEEQSCKSVSLRLSPLLTRLHGSIEDKHKRSDRNTMQMWLMCLALPLIWGDLNKSLALNFPTKWMIGVHYFRAFFSGPVFSHYFKRLSPHFCSILEVEDQKTGQFCCHSALRVCLSYSGRLWVSSPCQEWGEGKISF